MADRRGVLHPFPLAPEMDISVLVGFPLARQLFGYDGHPSRIYMRKVTSQMLAAGGFVEHCELGWRAAKLN